MKQTIIQIILVLLLLSTAALSAEDLSINTTNFKTAEIKGIVFKWEIVDENINIILSAPTNGWIAVGFNPSRMMKDADILIGYVKNGEVFMEDHFGSGNTKHRADTDLGGTEDITIISGSEEEDKTTIEFSIPLHSWDSNDRRLEKGEEYKVIFAYGKKD
ncbi:MAG: DOMON domain-containing protein, partial [Spirochaetales bacterium]|nr:DOMON domain-containing protein [Spirochaetales bacterium]